VLLHSEERLLSFMSAAVTLSGMWQGARVAVKIISHSAEDDMRISSELSLRWVPP